MLVRTPRVRLDEATVARVHRVDRYELRIDQGSIVHHENGWIDAWGVATRTGVFLYDDPSRPDGVSREYKPPSEVFDAASLATLVGIPFTIEHPPDLVTSANFSDLTHGTVLEYRAEGDLVWVRVRVATDQAKAAIEAGKVELSCGYTVLLDETPGLTPAGETYHAVHRSIRYNHLALVDLARAGHVARLKLDAGGRVQRLDQARRPTQGSPMKFKIKIDGKWHAIPALLVPGLSAESEKTAQAKRRGDAIETRAVSIETGEGMLELVLPSSAVDQILTMLGASEGAPAAEEPPADAAEEPPTVEEDPSVPPRMDAAAIEAMVSKAVTKAVADTVPKAIQAREDRARERSELERRCSDHLPAGYRFDQADDIAIALDTLEALEVPKLDELKAIGARARKGDARARGRLDATLDLALEQRRDSEDTTGEQMAGVIDMRKKAADSAGAPTMSRRERARQDRIAKMAGQKPAKQEPAAG